MWMMALIECLWKKQKKKNSTNSCKRQLKAQEIYIQQSRVDEVDRLAIQ